MDDLPDQSDAPRTADANCKASAGSNGPPPLQTKIQSDEQATPVQSLVPSTKNAVERQGAQPHRPSNDSQQLDPADFEDADHQAFEMNSTPRHGGTQRVSTDYPSSEAAQLGSEVNSTPRHGNAVGPPHPDRSAVDHAAAVHELRESGSPTHEVDSASSARTELDEDLDNHPDLDVRREDVRGYEAPTRSSNDLGATRSVAMPGGVETEDQLIDQLDNPHGQPATLDVTQSSSDVPKQALSAAEFAPLSPSFGATPTVARMGSKPSLFRLSTNGVLRPLSFSAAVAPSDATHQPTDSAVDPSSPTSLSTPRRTFSSQADRLRRTSRAIVLSALAFKPGTARKHGGVLHRNDDEKKARRHERRMRGVRFDVLRPHELKGAHQSTIQASKFGTAFSVLIPDAPLLRLLTSLRVLFCAYTVFWWPSSIAFAKHDDFHPWYLEIVPDAFFAVDMVLCFRTGFADAQSQVEMNVNEIFIRYTRTSDYFDSKHFGPNFWLDVLALIPLHIAYAAQAPLLVCQIISLPRLMRIQRLYAWFDAMQQDVHTSVQKVASFKFALMLFGVAHWVGCAWWWIASCTSPSFDETTWVSQYLKRFPLPSKSDPRELTSDPHDLALHVKLTLALFWGFQAMANLGYSDIVPNNFLEIAFGVICTFIQMNYYAYILGTLFQYVVHKDEEAELYRKRMKGLDAYGRGRHLPLALRTRLKRHFDFMSSKAELKQQKEVMDQLPPSLVAKVAEWEHIDVVTSVQLFAGTPEQFITMLCCKLKLKYLMPGELLFKRGDMSRELVFIQDGVVEVYEDKEQRKILRELSAGVVGELSFFMGIMQPFTMSASDKSDVTLKSLSKDDYEAILENYSEGHAMVASNLCLEYGLDRNGNEIDTIAARAAMSGAKTQEDQPAKSKKSTKKGSKSANAEAGNEDSDDWLALRKMLQAALKKRKDDALAAMIDAASEGDIDEIKRVLHQGLDVNTGDYDSRTMLHLSAAEGNVKVVKALLSEGADVNVTDRWGQMPLHDAIQANHTQVVELLASQGAELEFENAADKLCAAAADGDIESLKALIDHGISPNSADYDGRTALHLAAAEGIVNVLEFLLANKADVNVLDRWNNTPLDDAVKFLHELPARLLFEAGGALNLEYASGALCEAASEGDITRLRLLFENGTDVRVADYDNRTALHLAAAEGQLLSIDFLLYAKADVDFKDRWGGTALNDALSQGNLECARLLIGAGAEVTPDMPLSKTDKLALDSISLDIVRKKIRSEVLENDTCRRVRKQLKEQLKNMVIDLGTNLTKLQRLSKSFQDLTGNLLHRGGHEALVAASNTTMDELFALPAGPVAETEQQMRAVVGGGTPKDERGSQNTSDDHEKKERSMMLVRFLQEQRDGHDSLDNTPVSTSTPPLPNDWGQSPERKEVKTRRPNASDLECLPNDQVNEAVELSHNTVSNSGAGHAKDDAVKLVSFNQLILMFPVIEKGFTMLRAEFDACVRTKKLWGRARQLVRGDADANAAAGLVLNRSHLTYLVRTRMRIQTSKAQLAQIALHYVPMDSPTRGGEDASSIEDMEDMSPTTARDVSKSDVFSQWGAGDSGDAEIKTGSSDDEEGDDDIHLSFVELACSPVFHELVAKQAGRIRSGNVGTGPVGAISVESTYRSIVLAIDQCFSILNDAFGLLDINEKGMLTIGELKEAIGGELALGNELMRLFAGRNLIQRADFIVCFMRWVDVIDEKEFDDSGDGLEDAETLAHSRRVTIDQGGGFGNLVAEVVQRSQPTQASHNLAHRGWLSSTVTEIFAALKSANEAAEKHRSSFGAVSAWVRSASFSISFLYTEWRTQMPVDERWLRQLVELGVDIDDGLEHCFNWIDADGSGQIGYDEFVTMLQMIHFPLPVYKSQALFLQFSHDGHEFSYAEFEANVKRIAARASLITGHDARLDAMDGDADEARWQTTGYVTKNSLVRWVVIPGGRAEYMWNASLLVASVFYTASVPYVWSFVRTQLVRKSVTVPMYFFDAVLWANILRKFFTGYVNHHSVIVTKFDQIRAHYLQSDLFFDIVAANPLDLVVWLVDGGPGTAAWLRLFRILRFWDIWAYLHQSMSNMHSSHIYSELTKLLVLTIVLLHFCACYWHYLTRTEGAGQNYLSHANYTEYGSGVTCGEDNDAERPECALHVNEYMVSLYWVTAGMFAIGAGDLLPQNETEQWFTILLAVINLSFLAYVLGTMSSLFMSADEELVATRHEMRAVERLISSKKIPPAITEEVRAHFDYKADQTENGVNEDEETEIFRSLSLELQVEVAQHISRAPLQNAVVFHLCGDNFLDMMSTQLHEVTISPGTVLFAVNDICRTLQIIVSGSVDLFTRSVETHGDALDSTVRSGDVIAPIPFFFNVRHTCTGRTAVSQFVRMFVLEREDYKRLIKLYPSEEEVISRNVLDGESDDKKSSSGKSRSSASRSQGSYNSLGSVEMSEMSGGSRRSEGEGSVTGSQSGSQYSGLAFGDEEQLNVITQAIEKARKKRDMERVCAMCTAAAKGSLEELKLLSEGGDISLNQGDYDLRTPFHLAASEGHAHVVHWLLEVGADAYVKDRYDGTPVNDAVRERKDGVLALLREHGSSLDIENAASLLCVSAYNGDNDQLRRLVEARVNPNDTDYDGRTAVHLASSEGHIGCLKYLISQFADLNRIDRWGGTPLTDAIRHKQVEVQQLLRMNGANLPKGDNAAGRLCELASTGEGSELQLLVQNGVDVNIGDYDYRRALHLAACNGHLAILESLIDCPNVDINPVDRLGGTPLEDAIREGQAAAAALLEKHGGVRAGHPSLSERLQMRNEQGKLRMTEKDDRVTTERAQHERESEMNSRMAKAIEDRVRLFRKQQVRLDALCLTIHPRGQYSAKAISASPRPTLPEALVGFRQPFQKFLKRRHARHYLECYELCIAFANHPILETLSNIHMLYLVKGARHQLNVPPEEIRSVAQAVDGETTRMRPDLPLGVQLFMEKQLEEHLRSFHSSREFKIHSVSREGRFWRVLVLCRQVRDATAEIQSEVIPVLTEIAAEETTKMIFNQRKQIAQSMLAQTLAVNKECDKVLDCVKKAAASARVIFDRAQQRKQLLEKKLSRSQKGSHSENGNTTGSQNGKASEAAMDNQSDDEEHKRRARVESHDMLAS